VSCLLTNYTIPRPIVPSISDVIGGIGGPLMVSLFKQAIATPVERYLIGDLREVLRFKARDKTKNSDFNYSSLGIIGGGIAVWRPKSKEEMTTALNELDTQSNARSNYQSAQLLINSSPFLLADASISAIHHRKEVSQFFIPSKLASLTWDLWKKGNALDLSDHHIPMQVVAKGVLGIELSADECFILDDLSRAFKKYSLLPIPSSLLKLMPEFRKQQSEYQQCIEGILQREFQKFKSSATENRGEGLIIQEMIKKMEQNPDCKDLHKDPELKSLILFLIAVDNLSEALARVPYLITADFEELLKEVDNGGIIQDDATINTSIILDKEKMPRLDGLYQRCIDSGEGKIILGRYVQNGLQCGEHQVPPRTYLAITAPIENRSPYHVFSAGRRSCPGRFVAEAIFKTILAAKISHLSPSVRANMKEWSSQNYIR